MVMACLTWALAVAVLLAWGYCWWRSEAGRRWLRPYRARCLRCGGITDGDPACYRGVVVWTCRDCGDRVETLPPRR